MDDMTLGLELGKAMRLSTDTSALNFVVLAQNALVDDVTITEHSDLFIAWSKIESYKINDIREYKGLLYRCVQAHQGQANWSPDKTASLWVKIGNPAEAFPEWSQPMGAHDAYAKGTKVTFKGKKYESIINNNVYSPEAYLAGWSFA